MFAVQTTLFAIIANALSSHDEQPANSNMRPGGDGQPANDPRDRLIAALADMLPSTLQELSQTTALEPETAEAYLTEMSGRRVVMFNPLTKRYSLPKLASGGALAA